MTLLTIADGPPCEEATHAWTPWLGTGAVLINEPSIVDVPLDDLDAPRSPNRIVLDEAPDFYAGADGDDNREPLHSQPGELLLPSERLGVTKTYRMHAEATTLVGLRAMMAPFRAAFRGRYRPGRMLITPGAGYGEIAWFFDARVLSCEPSAVTFEEGTLAPCRQQIVLEMLLPDPRFYVAGDPDLVSGDDGDTVVATNEGNDDTDPTFTIAVPIGLPDLYLENLSVATSSGTAALSLVAVPAGVLVVNFRDRTITIDGDPADGIFDSANSDWWDEQIPGMQPGPNELKVTGADFQARWRHASA